MNIDIIKNEKDFYSLEPIWNDLLKESCSNSIFQTFEWYKSWIKTCLKAENSSPYILTFSTENNVKGIAPFMRVKEKNKKILKFLSQPYPDYQDLIVEKDYGEKFIKLIIRKLISRKKDFSKIVLNQFSQSSPTYTRFHKELRLRNYNSNIKNISPSLRINYNKVKKLRELRRKCTYKYIKKLEKDFGPIEFNFITNKQKLEDILSLLITQHIKRWKNHDSHPNGSRLKKKNIRNFYFSLLKNLSINKWINIATISCRDIEDPLAISLGFLYKNYYTMYCSSFENDYYDYYTGLILWRKLIKYGYDKEWDYFDFSRGDHSYKYRYSNEIFFNKSLETDLKKHY